MNKENDLAIGFRNVDSANILKIMRCLDGMQAMEAFQKYKLRTIELLLEEKNCGSAIDVACGLGDDVARLKQYFTKAVGVDSSVALINEAVHRHQGTNCEFLCSNATELPFADNEFDCARIDRSLQHIVDPDKVVREMLRVVKAGGRILCAEPDWGTFFIGTSLSDVTKAIQNHWVSNIRNPWIGRNLHSIMKTAGVQNLSLEGHVLITESFDRTNLVFDISKTVEEVQGLLNNRAEAETWLDNYRNGDAIAGAMLIICHGTK